VKNIYQSRITHVLLVSLSLPLGFLGCRGESSTDDTTGAGAPGTGGKGSASSGGAPSTGGEGGEGGGGAGGEGGVQPIECPSGAGLVMSDYLSTELALLDLDGRVTDASFLSTASTETDGLAFPLSGDIVVPLGNSGELVVLDRYGTNVVSFVDTKTAKVRAQLPVGMGFESNPHDYLQLTETEGALVRYGQNPNPGQEKFDDGGDLLFIDSEEALVEESVVFESYDKLPPRPSQISRVGDTLYVTLDRLAVDYLSMGDAMLVPVSITSRKASTPLRLRGLKSCGGLVPVPGRDEVAVACTGRLTDTGEVESISQSAIVFFDAKSSPIRELRRVAAKEIANEPIQNQFAFARENVILVKTQTAFGGDRNNRLLSYNLETEQAEELLEATPDSMGKGRGLAFGTLLCAVGCSDTCLMPDSSRGEVVRVRVQGDDLELLEPATLDGSAGLPPSSLGSF
jgi:hypothetical protein